MVGCGWLGLLEQHLENASGHGSPAIAEPVRASIFESEGATAGHSSDDAETGQDRPHNNQRYLMRAFIAIERQALMSNGYPLPTSTSPSNSWAT